MKIHYICDCCSKPIDTIEVAEIDEVRFGFDCLTKEEREAIIKVDTVANIMVVQSLCDGCIQLLGLAEEVLLVQGNGFLH
jgi:hypothetical protein